MEDRNDESKNSNEKMHENTVDFLVDLIIDSTRTGSQVISRLIEEIQLMDECVRSFGSVWERESMRERVNRRVFHGAKQLQPV